MKEIEFCSKVRCFPPSHIVLFTKRFFYQERFDQPHWNVELLRIIPKGNFLS